MIDVSLIKCARLLGHLAFLKNIMKIAKVFGLPSFYRPWQTWQLVHNLGAWDWLIFGMKYSYMPLDNVEKGKSSLARILRSTLVWYEI